MGLQKSWAWLREWTTTDNNRPDWYLLYAWCHKNNLIFMILSAPHNPTWLSTFLLCCKFYLVRCLSLLIYSQDDLNQNFCYTRICWIQTARCIAEWMTALANYIHLPSLYFIRKKWMGINTLPCAFTPYSPVMHQKFWILNKEKFLFI
jgi:hypothetical protein